jgi:hypothetical protein
MLLGKECNVQKENFSWLIRKPERPEADAYSS